MGEIAKIARHHHHPVTLGGGSAHHVNGGELHASSRSARYDGAPDFSDVPIDAKDPTLKAVCQIDLQPTTQALATRTRRQSLDAPPNFAKGEHAEE
jgi:hypothetical protein